MAEVGKWYMQPTHFSSLVTSSLGIWYSILECQKSKVNAFPVISQRVPHGGDVPPALDFHDRVSALTPAVTDLNCLSNFPPTRTSLLAALCSSIPNACSQQIQADSPSPRDLPNISSRGISQFSQV